MRADVSTVKHMHSLTGHKDSVLCVAVDPRDHNILASGSDDSTVRIWDLRTSKSVRCVRGAFDGAGVSCVEWSDLPAKPVDGAGDAGVGSVEASRWLLASAGQQLYSFDLRAEGVILTVPSVTLAHNTDEINQFALHDDGRGGRHIAIADDAGAVCVVDISTGRLAKVLKKHTMFASTLAFRPGRVRGLELVSGGFDCSAIVWDVLKGKARVSINMSASGMTDDAPSAQMVNPAYVHSVACSPSGAVFAAGLGDGSVSIHDATTYVCKQRLWPHTRGVGRVEYPLFMAAEGGDREHTLATSSNDGRVLVLDVREENGCGDDVSPMGRSGSGSGAKKKNNTKGKSRAAGESVSPAAAAPSSVESPDSASSPDVAEASTVVAAASAPYSRVLYNIDHGSGPNWMCTTSACGGAIVVADPSPTITVYAGIAHAAHTRLQQNSSAAVRK